MTNDNSKQVGTLSLWQVLASVLASFFGVQNEARRTRDFVRGKPSQYVLIGLILTVVFIVTVWLLVTTVLHFAGI